jgi:hypothetical protein
MSQPIFNSSPRAPIKIIPDAIPLILSAPQKSFLKPTFIPAATRLLQTGWPSPGTNRLPLRKNHLRKYPNGEKQKANVLILPSGSFNH